MLKIMKAWKSNLKSVLLVKKITIIRNQLKGSRMVLALLVALSWQSPVDAREIDAATLVPIINLLLEEQEAVNIQCPSFEPVVIIEDGILVSFQTPEGQSIEGDVFLTSQQGIDQLAGVVRINGDLIISPQSIVVDESGLAFGIDSSLEVDLSPLNLLSEVAGTVSIRTGNASFDEFNCLTYVGESLSLFGNDELTSIDGFRSLGSIGENIIISSNDRLQSIKGFQSLESVGNSLVISSHSELQDISGFNVLSFVGRDFQIASNTGLGVVDGFPLLASIGNNFSIANNDGLRSISAFPLLENVGSNLNISNNSVLEGIGSLSVLERGDVRGDIIITSNPSFDCGVPVPNFAEATFSSGNLVDCPQDLFARTISASNDESVVIADESGVSSSITIPAQSGITGVVRSLEVSLDIEHTAVGNLTLTLSNGDTTINLLDRPSALLTQASIGMLSNCFDVTNVASFFPVTNFPSDVFSPEDLAEFISGASNDTLGINTADLFNQFPSIDIDCATNIINSSDNAINAEIAAQCVSDFPEDDFLSEASGGRVFTGTSDSFASLDANCVIDRLTALEEANDAPSCRSNNITVSFSGDTSLPQINTNCASDDSAEAYPLPSYFPLESLAAFQGDDLNGTWTLTVTDSEAGDTGVLNSWGIVFNIDR